jgi:hypothetical protein
VPPPPPSRITRITRPAGDLGSPVFSVQTDATNVYFNDGAGRLWTAPKDGSQAAVALVADPQDSVRSFVVSGDTIYYAARHELRSVPISGGPSTHDTDSRSGPLVVVSDGRDVYHSVFDGSGTYRWSLATGHSERFCAGGKHQTLAVDDANLYIGSYGQSTITAISKRTRKARVVTIGARHPVRLVSDGDFIYFSSEADGAVRRVPKRGGKVEVLARGQHDQEHLALDEAFVYWTTRTDGGKYSLVRAPRTGGEPEVLYADLSSAAGLAVDEGYVYVADRGAGEVVRVKKQFP